MTSRRRFQPGVSNHPKPKGRPTHYPRIIQESRFLSNLPYPVELSSQVWLSSRRNSIFSGATRYQWPTGSEFSPVSNEEDAQLRMPGPATFKRMTAAVENLLSGGTIVFTLRVNGADTALTATMFEGKRIASGEAEVSVSEGDLVSISIVITVGASQKPNIALWFIPEVPDRFYYVGGTGSNPTTSIVPNYNRQPAFNFGDITIGSITPLKGTNSIGAQYSVVSTSGRIRAFHGQLYGFNLLGSGQNFVLSIIRGFEGNEEILSTLVFNEGEREKTSKLNIRVLAGELIAIGAQQSVSGVSNEYRHGIVFEPDRKDWFMLGNGFNSGFGHSSGTQFLSWALSDDADTPESEWSHVTPVKMEMKEFYYQAEIGTGGPGSGTSFVMRSRINGANGNMIATVADEEEEATDLRFLDVLDREDEFNWSAEAVNSPNDDHFAYSVAARVP